MMRPAIPPKAGESRHLDPPDCTAQPRRLKSAMSRQMFASPVLRLRAIYLLASPEFFDSSRAISNILSWLLNFSTKRHLLQRTI